MKLSDRNAVLVRVVLKDGEIGWSDRNNPLTSLRLKFGNRWSRRIHISAGKTFLSTPLSSRLLISEHAIFAFKVFAPEKRAEEL